jgi:6-phosphogluconolactonase/glucosamine-6-phosphate isomerase/deaminase
MNLSMILESKNIFLLVSSEKKLEVLNQAKTDSTLPLYYLLNQNISDIKIVQNF